MKLISCRQLSRTQLGFSVMELMVAMALLAGMIGLSLPYIDSVMGVSLRQSVRQLSGSVRFLYDRASVTGTTYRIAFNLDRHAWWVEENDAEGEVLIFKSERARVEGEEAAQKLLEEIEAQRNRASSASQPLPLAERAMSTFHRVESEDLPPVVLPENVFLMGVWTAQYDEVQRPNDVAPEKEEDDRVVYVHLFRGGYAEKAFIYLSDGEEDGDIYTLEVEPLTGRVLVYEEEVEVPRELLRH